MIFNTLALADICNDRKLFKSGFPATKGTEDLTLKCHLRK